jgi:NOL1/NOP2/sun family putative RNA methylase
MDSGKNYVKKTNKEKLMERYKPKEEFVQRIEKLIGKEDAKKFFEIAYFASPDFIRVNTLKISPEEMKKRLESYGWIISQPYLDFPEVLLVERESHLVPGALGKTFEHLLGYYYVQEISSMLPIFALKPQADELFLDLCSSPGSKTTQAAALMNNQGTIIANEVSLGRIRILSANLEKSGVSNTIITRKDGVQFCKRWTREVKLKFDKILVDAPCSGEGTLRKSPKTFDMWNLSYIKALSKVQKKLASEALKLLKVDGEMIYSTCTLGPEEDEAVVNYLKENFDIEIMKIDLPLKTRDGILEWEGETYNPEIKNCRRLYPQDNNSDGFFLAKIKKLSEDCKLTDVEESKDPNVDKVTRQIEEGLLDEEDDYSEEGENENE